MKKIITIIISTALLCSNLCTANTKDTWQTICLPHAQHCQSLWKSIKLPQRTANVLIAYSITLKENDLPVGHFLINLNNVTLAPEQNSVGLTANKRLFSLPIISQHLDGVTAQLSNLNAMNQVLTQLGKSKTFTISFMEKDADDLTTVTVPVGNLKEALNHVPHGDVLFWKNPT